MNVIPLSLVFSLVALSQLAPISRAVSRDACERGKSDSLLILTERARLRLPSSYSVTGGAAGPSATVLLLDNRSDHLLLVRRNAFRAIPLPAGASVTGAAFVDGDSIVELVDARHRSVLRFNLSRERVLGEQFFDTDLAAVESAAFVAGTWFLGGRTVRSEFRLVEVAADGTTHVVGVPLWNGPTALPTAYVAGHNSDLIVTGLSSPFKAILLDPAGDLKRTITPADCLTSQDRLTVRDWISLPVLPVEPGYLQVLSDLKSDERMLVVYDESGNPIRTTRINVPLGLFAVSQTQHLLYGLIAVGSEELIVYDWRWRRLQGK